MGGPLMLFTQPCQHMLIHAASSGLALDVMLIPGQNLG